MRALGSEPGYCRFRPYLDCTPRFVLHFTPTSSSWINLVERWFSELTTKLLKRGAHSSVHQLNADIRQWIDSWNENPRPYVWTKTADQILDSINATANELTPQHTRQARAAQGLGRGRRWTWYTVPWP